MKNPLIAGINLYQKAFSPYKGAGSFCKYYPTCSQYAKEAIQKYGSLKVTSMAMKRILRCNPFSKGGYDPVP